MSVTGSVVAANGLYSVGSYSGSYSDGTVVDYVTGNGRISVGPADNLTLYAGGPANTSIGVFASGSTTLNQQLYLTGIGTQSSTLYLTISTPSGKIGYATASGSGGGGASGSSGTSGTSGTSPTAAVVSSSGLPLYIPQWLNSTTLQNSAIQQAGSFPTALIGINQVPTSYALEVTGDIYATGNIIAFSDESVKDNVKTITNALDKVNKMRGVTFTRNDEQDKDRVYAGVIAQEMAQAFPEVVFDNADGTKAVAYPSIVSVLIEAIKEQQLQIDQLKEEIKNLKK